MISSVGYQPDRGGQDPGINCHIVLENIDQFNRKCIQFIDSSN